MGKIHYSVTMSKSTEVYKRFIKLPIIAQTQSVKAAFDELWVSEFSKYREGSRICMSIFCDFNNRGAKGGSPPRTVPDGDNFLNVFYTIESDEEYAKFIDRYARYFDDSLLDAELKKELTCKTCNSYPRPVSPDAPVGLRLRFTF